MTPDALTLIPIARDPVDTVPLGLGDPVSQPVAQPRPTGNLGQANPPAPDGWRSTRDNNDLPLFAATRDAYPGAELHTAEVASNQAAEHQDSAQPAPPRRPARESSPNRAPASHWQPGTSSIRTTRIERTGRHRQPRTETMSDASPNHRDDSARGRHTLL